ncbi:MAG: hypothetical protein G01um101431_15 [Parcubacteria group bacterium Gr01-1014_31]|nr:MAG: hypothetical protein G01um101431_15 [Parcubacteria group bacterium Gr01-1014_31]
MPRFMRPTFAVAIVAVAVAALNVAGTAQLFGQVKSSPTPVPPPRLQVTVVTDAACAECASLEPVVAQLAKFNIVLERATFERNSTEGAALLTRYGIVTVPTLVVSGDVDALPELASFWQKLGRRAADAVILDPPIPPYRDVQSGQIRGRVAVTLVGDAACTTCYDANEHLTILARFGIKDENPRRVDIRSTDGQTLRRDYGITMVPTFVLTGEVGVYEGLSNIWVQVGTTEKDGAYVFRQGVASMGTYRDLATGKIILPTPTPTPSPVQGVQP